MKRSPSVLSSWTTSLDIFGKSITLTYNGSEQHKTLCGGISTLLLYSWAILIIILYLIKLFDKTVIFTQTKEVPHSINYFDEGYSVSPSDLDFLIKITNEDDSLLFGELAPRIKAVNIIKFKDENKKPKTLYYPINVIRWTDEFVSSTFAETLDNLEDYFWLAFTKLQLNGTYDSDFSSLIKITVDRCALTNGLDWPSDESLSLISPKKYFDVTDSKDPVKQQGMLSKYDSNVFSRLRLKDPFHKLKYFGYKINELSQDNGLFGENYINHRYSSFVEQETDYMATNYENPYSASIFISLDRTKLYQETKVYKIWDMIPELGGSLLVLFWCFKIFMKFIVDKIVKHDLVNDLNKQFGAEALVKKAERLYKQRNNHIYQRDIEVGKDNKSSDYENLWAKIIKELGPTKSEDRVNYTKERFPDKYSTSDLMYSFLTCFCCYKKGNKRRSISSKYETYNGRNYMINKEANIFYQRLDWVQIVKVIKKLQSQVDKLKYNLKYSHEPEINEKKDNMQGFVKDGNLFERKEVESGHDNTPYSPITVEGQMKSQSYDQLVNKDNNGYRAEEAKGNDVKIKIEQLKSSHSPLIQNWETRNLQRTAAAGSHNFKFVPNSPTFQKNMQEYELSSPCMDYEKNSDSCELDLYQLPR